MKFYEIAQAKLGELRRKYTLARLSLDDVVVQHFQFDIHPQTRVPERRPVLMWQAEFRYCCYFEIPIKYELKAKPNARFLSELEWVWDADAMWKSAEEEIREYLGLGVDHELDFADDIIDRPPTPRFGLSGNSEE